MSETPATEEETPARPNRNSRIALQIVAVFLVLIGIGAITLVVAGLRSGHLLPFWNNLTDPQGSIIASLVTLYAAALAAILGPLIFTGQIGNMQAASERALSLVDAQIQRMTEQLEHIRKMVRQTEEAVLPSKDSEAFDPEKALLKLESIREDATALAQSLVEKSNRWKSTKEKTKRKWPGRKPYYNLLHNLRFISEDERDLFIELSDTRLLKPNDVTAADVAAAEEKLSQLKSSTTSKPRPTAVVAEVGAESTE